MTSPTRPVAAIVDDRELTGVNYFFRHPDLQDATTQIRLLRFTPYNNADQLCLQMGAYDLELMHRKYVAISYTWGDSEDLTTITVNQQSFAITRNGAQALLKAYKCDRHALFWIE